MRILIIDDEQEILEYYQKLIKPTGHKLITTRNPLEALEICRKESFDLVMTDYRMPEMNGLEFLKKVKQVNSKLRVLIFTAYKEDGMVKEAGIGSAYAFLEKPVTLAELLYVLHIIEQEILKESLQLR